MPVPFLILGAMGVASATGVGFGIDGAIKIGKAKKKVKQSRKRHEDAVHRMRRHQKRFERKAEAYADLQRQALSDWIGPALIRLDELGYAPDPELLQALDGLDLQPEAVKGKAWRLKDSGSSIMDAATALGAGTASSQGAAALVGGLARAGTGQAIRGLSGAAARNATLAWLGGGPLAAGGGGMALGQIVLSSLNVGPAVLVGGLMLNKQGNKAKTRATETVAEVNKKVAEIEEVVQFMDQIGVRVDELSAVLKQLGGQVQVQLRQCREGTLGRAIQRGQARRLSRLVAAAIRLICTPVLTEAGMIHPDTVRVIRRARRLL